MCERDAVPEQNGAFTVLGTRWALRVTGLLLRGLAQCINEISTALLYSLSSLCRLQGQQIYLGTVVE